MTVRAGRSTLHRDVLARVPTDEVMAEELLQERQEQPRDVLAGVL